MKLLAILCLMVAQMGFAQLPGIGELIYSEDGQLLMGNSYRATEITINASLQDSVLEWKCYNKDHGSTYIVDAKIVEYSDGYNESDSAYYYKLETCSIEHNEFSTYTIYPNNRSYSVVPENPINRDNIPHAYRFVLGGDIKFNIQL